MEVLKIQGNNKRKKILNKRAVEGITFNDFMLYYR